MGGTLIYTASNVAQQLQQAGQIYETREEWLQAAVVGLASLFPSSKPVPPVRVSVGFPGGNANRKTVRGQCWAPATAADGITQIFLTPWIETPVTYLLVLLHELVHASVGCDCGHKGDFIAVGRQVGLVPKWTTATGSPELIEHLTRIAEELGTFPHGALCRPGEGVLVADNPKKQGTRMLKVVCPSNGLDGYVARTTNKWLEKWGAPICPCCHEQMELAA